MANRFRVVHSDVTPFANQPRGTRTWYVIQQNEPTEYGIHHRTRSAARRHAREYNEIFSTRSQ